MRATIVLAGAAVVHGFVATPQGLTTILSEKFPDASITYKQTAVCETTPGVNAYSGYVHLPKSVLDAEDSTGWNDTDAAHMYFWYFESRNNPESAPTAIRLGGGPGTTSLGATTNFPCRFGTDGNSTTVNPESWNLNSNVLYIDQPIGTGFSYVSLRNGTTDFLTSTFTTGDESTPVNQTTVRATSDQMWQGDRELINMALVPRTTAGAARILWLVSQVFFNEFIPRRTSNNEISVWGSSYGGFYAPALMATILDQNDLIKSGTTLPEHANATVLQLGTLGLVEACVDAKLTAKVYPEFARNNTYGIQLYNESIYDQIVALVDAPEKGCNALIDNCRALSAQSDPRQTGLNETVNAACAAATEVCFGMIQGAGTEFTSRSPFDVTMDTLVLMPPFHEMSWFNQEYVQADLGVPLNFTAPTNANPILASFFGIVGDPMVRDISALKRVLAAGLNVAMATGDRDYRCPWTGAEAVALDAVPALSKAGYAPFKNKGNCTAPTGLTRETGPISITRVFQAGHGIAPYASKTLFNVFERARKRLDVATGKVDLKVQTSYASQGQLDVRDVMNEVPEPPPSTCYLYSVPTSCTKEQVAALADGSAVIENFIVVSPAGLNGIRVP